MWICELPCFSGGVRCDNIVLCIVVDAGPNNPTAITKIDKGINSYSVIQLVYHVQIMRL